MDRRSGWLPAAPNEPTSWNPPIASALTHVQVLGGRSTTSR
jgi:hypothetical protein